MSVKSLVSAGTQCRDRRFNALTPAVHGTQFVTLFVARLLIERVGISRLAQYRPVKVKAIILRGDLYKNGVPTFVVNEIYVHVAKKADQKFQPGDALYSGFTQPLLTSKRSIPVRGNM